jgi:DNA-binding response OmpR family regulator
MPDFRVRKATRIARFGEIALDFRKMELSRADQPVGLTLQEFKVLRFLISRPGIVVSRRELITAVWPKRKRSSCRTVDNCIAKLRQKIEEVPAQPVHLRTVHGVGYKFVPRGKAAARPAGMAGAPRRSTPRPSDGHRLEKSAVIEAESEI